MDNANPPESTEPLSRQPLDPAPQAPQGKSVFHIDMRDKPPRRQLPDRRQTVRFESERRSGADRRPDSVSPWNDYSV